MIGNRLSQVDHATTSGGANTTTGYTYPAAGASRPHALTATTATTGSSSVTAGYTYDAAGNTLTRPAASGSAQTLTWDPEGHLATSTDGTGTTSYVYDADGNRLISHDPAGATLFLPGQEVRYKTATGAATCTRYYLFNGSTIASRTATGVSWLSSDPQGTATVSIDRETQNVSIRRQNPFGVARGSSVAWPNTRGFVGGTVDDTGMTHLGAREYDPKIGRFASVDPVQDLADPQQWNAYTYASSNPVTNSDPSGLCDTDVCYSHQFHLDDRDQPVASAGNTSGSGCDMECIANKPAPHDGISLWAMHTLEYNGSKTYTYKDALKWASQVEAGYMFVCIHTFGHAENSCDESDPWTKPKVGHWNWKALLVPLVLVGAIGAAELCLDTLPACIYTTGNGVAGFYGYGNFFGTPDELALSLVRMEASGDVSGDALKLMLDRCSFSPDTKVLLADSSTKPIKDVEVGDVVVATDPEKGKTTGKSVTRLYDHLDTDLADVTVTDRRGVKSILHPTQDHPLSFSFAGRCAWNQHLLEGDGCCTALRRRYGNAFRLGNERAI